MHPSAERLYKAAKELKGAEGQSAIARLLNESPQNVNNWESRGVSRPGAIKAQAALGCDANWVLTGGGQMASTPAAEPEPIDMGTHPELVPIKRGKLRLVGGMSGFAVDPDDEQGTPIFFRADWMRERGYKASALLAHKVRGHSMEPTLFDGDLVVINTADVEPKDGEVFAVNYEGEPVIKRLVRDEGVWWLSSDNRDKTRYPNKKWMDKESRLIGRIVHKQSERI